MKYFKDLTEERWFQFTFDEQMANAGMEIGRGISKREKDKKGGEMFFKIGLELLNATRQDPKNVEKMGELLRVKKDLVDYFSSITTDEINNKKWNDYFYAFAWRAALACEEKYKKSS